MDCTCKARATRSRLCVSMQRPHKSMHWKRKSIQSKPELTPNKHCSRRSAVVHDGMGFDISRLVGNATTLALTIGSHIEPLLPAPDGVAIAFEPVVHSLIKPQPRLFVVPAAVAAEDGIAAMEKFAGIHGSQSSSLSAPARQAYWNHGVGLIAVPVVSFRGLLASLPPADVLTLHALKTDMQGHDFATLESVGAQLRRAHWVLAETYLRGDSAYKLPVGNDFCSLLLPHMTRMGYKLHELRATLGTPGRPILASSTARARAYCAEDAARARLGTSDGLSTSTPHREANALWRLNTTRLAMPSLKNWRLDN